MTYEIKYNYNNQDVKDGKFSLESARHFAKKAARYAGSCDVVSGDQTVETWVYDEDAGRVVRPQSFLCEEVEYSLAEMMAANIDDEDVCGWLKSAEVGDEWLGVTRLKRIS